jgi:hypothetical protein
MPMGFWLNGKSHGGLSMTCQYNEINQHDALYTAARAYPGGIEALACRMGTTANMLYKKLRPAVDSHHVNYEEVSEIIELLEGARQFEAADQAIRAFNWRHGRVAIRLPDGDSDSSEMFGQVLEIMREEGQLAEDINKALADDGRINDQELSRIERDLQLCIQALCVLRNEVRAKHDADIQGRF